MSKDSTVDKIDKFGWKDSYKIGNKNIDAEHKKLFTIAQQAFNIKEDEQIKKRVKKVIVELYNYMQTHFKAEEKFMSRIQYPWLEEQEDMHAHIIDETNKLIQKLPTMDIKHFLEDLKALIQVLFLEHIIHEDKKIIDWVDSTN